MDIPSRVSHEYEPFVNMDIFISFRISSNIDINFDTNSFYKDLQFLQANFYGLYNVLSYVDRIFLNNVLVFKPFCSVETRKAMAPISSTSKVYKNLYQSETYVLSFLFLTASKMS